MNLAKCKDCNEQIDISLDDCLMCEDCCYEYQMKWQEEAVK